MGFTRRDEVSRANPRLPHSAHSPPVRIGTPSTHHWLGGAVAIACLFGLQPRDAAAQFSAHADFATGTTPRNVAIADLNRDGKLDLAVPNTASATISVLLGVGDGSFGAKTDFTTGTTPRGVAIADLNRDGKLDLAVANNGSNTVSVLLGNGAGSFATKVDYATGANPFPPSIADLNGDGKLDLAVPNQNGPSVSILLGTGTGSFGAKTDFTTGTQPVSVVIADLNLDGKLDLAVANNGSANFSVLLGTGTGSFGAKTDFALAAGGGPFFVSAADLDADGRPDLAVAISNTNSVSVLLNTTPAGGATPTFGGASDYATGTSPRGVTIADFDGDGRLDLAVANFTTSNVSVLLGTGGGIFGPRTDYATGTSAYLAAIGDVNGDGRPDLAAVCAGSNVVSVLLNTYPAPAAPLVFAGTNFATGTTPRSAAIADLNRDGKLDVAVANGDAATVSVLPGIGDGSFGAKTDYSTGAGVRGLAVADLNGDGVLDLATANTTANTVSVILGTGAGTFGAKTDFATGLGPWAIAIADLNLDGKPDLAVTDIDAATASVLLGTGTGAFGAKTDFATGSDPSSVAIGDINGDGKPDLVVANNGSGTVSVLIGNGAGGFGTKSDFTAGSAPYGVAIGDLSGDGRLDLAVSDGAAAAAAALVLLSTTTLGGATPSFAAAVSYTTGTSPVAVAIGDLNRDGRPDLAVANSGTNNVSVLLGTGGGGFGAKTDSPGGGSPSSVVIADVNRDGAPDLVVANSSSNTVSVLLPAYTLIVTTLGNGSVSKNPDLAAYMPGTAVQLTATPLPGQSFVSWGGDASGSVNPLTVTMDGNKSVIANFTCSLNVTVIGLGSVSKSPDLAAYMPGSTVQLTAMPSNGSVFEYWSGDATGTANPLSVTMNGNKAVTGTFVHASGSVSLRWGDCGNGLPNQSFSCTSNIGSHRLVASLSLDVDVPQVTTITADLIVQSADSPLPAWWEFTNAGTCRQSALSYSATDRAGSLCNEWSSGVALGGITAYTIGYPGPDRALIRVTSAVPLANAATLSAGEEYFAFALNIANSLTVGTGSCSGCLTPASIRLMDVTLYTMGGGTAILAGSHFGLDDDYADWQGGVPHAITGVPHVAGQDLAPPSASPNPFAHEVSIAFSLSVATSVVMEVFDVVGRRVRVSPIVHVGPGRQSLAWDGLSDDGIPLGSGIYLIRVRGPGLSASRTVVRMK